MANAPARPVPPPKSEPVAPKAEPRTADSDAVTRAIERATRDHRELVEDLAK